MSSKSSSSDEGCLFILLAVVIVFLIVVMLAVASSPSTADKQPIETYLLRVTEEEVIVPNGYKLVAVSEDQYYCQKQNEEVNMIVECGPNAETIGDGYILPEGYTLIGIKSDSSTDTEKVFFCMNIRTERVTYCNVHELDND